MGVYSASVSDSVMDANLSFLRREGEEEKNEHLSVDGAASRGGWRVEGVGVREGPKRGGISATDPTEVRLFFMGRGGEASVSSSGGEACLTFLVGDRGGRIKEHLTGACGRVGAADMGGRGEGRAGENEVSIIPETWREEGAGTYEQSSPDIPAAGRGKTGTGWESKVVESWGDWG